MGGMAHEDDDTLGYDEDDEPTEVDLRPPLIATVSQRRGARGRTLDGRPPTPSVLMSQGDAGGTPARWQRPLHPIGARLTGAAFTHVGMVRSDNEDAYLVWPDAHLMVIADGMGGHQAGDVASRVAIECLRDHLVRGGVPMAIEAAQDRVVDAVHAAHGQITTLSGASESLKGMGTTLVVLWIIGDQALAVHVGDSRLYRARGDQLDQITGDHSLAFELKRRGILDTQGMQAFRHKNVLTQALGGKEALKPDAAQFTVQPGDRFLLCTDGLSDLVDGDRMRAALTGSQPPEDQARDLVEAALGEGGRDNITVVVAHID